jgi:3-hydroxyacyl-[acyl-carrier-protein] dehydratase
MPPAPFVILEDFELDKLEYGPDEIRERNPHRHELELLTGVIAYRPEEEIIIGEHQARPDAFWVRGHIPGRPLFPGVLMVETAAQLCSFYWRMVFPDSRSFFGFGGIENTRFRGTVGPTDRLILVGKTVQLKPRRAVFDTQGFVDGRMVFETRILGMTV